MRNPKRGPLHTGEQPGMGVTADGYCYPNKNAEKAQQLYSQLCYKLKTERDTAINCQVTMD